MIVWGKISDMTFTEFDEKEKELSIICKKANGNAQSDEFRKYNGLFWELYDAALEFEKCGKIKREPGKKSIGYLKEILENDGPEYCYTIEFQTIGEAENRYRIGVCVRGWPLLEKVTGVKDSKK